MLKEGVPGGKVNILGGHNIGYSKQYIYIYIYILVYAYTICMYMCLIPNGFQDRAISLYSSKTVDKKEILHTVSNTGIYCSSDKVRAVYLV
jgi:hypothetical protein